MRHPMADRDDLPLVHVTRFNALMWDCGARRPPSSSTASRTPATATRGESPRVAVVVNEARRRGAVTGTDLVDRFADVGRSRSTGWDAGAGMLAGRATCRRRAARGDGAPARLPAPVPLDQPRPLAARGDDHRDAGDGARHDGGARSGPAGRRASCHQASTSSPARAPPGRRPRRGGRARPRRARRALARFGLDRFLSDWDDVLEEVAGDEDRDGVGARQPAGRAGRRGRGRAERARRRARAGRSPLRGHRVLVYTRRDATALPRRVRLAPGVEVDHVDAGPPCAAPAIRAGSPVRRSP